jgi:lipoprotein LprG
MRHPALASVVALVLAAAVGCGGGGGGPSAEELVRESVDATAAIQSFHFTLDVQGVPRTSAGLQLTAAEGDVLTPDRARADVTGNFAGTPITTQVVAIGDDVWLKNPLSGDWQPIDVSATPLALLDPSQGVLGVMTGITDPTDEGTEELNGVELRKIGGSAPARDVAPLVAVAPSDRDVPVTLWIGEEDRLLRRIEVSGPVADGEPADALRVVEVSRFDEPVTIEAPEGTG